MPTPYTKVFLYCFKCFSDDCIGRFRLRNLLPNLSSWKQAKVIGKSRISRRALSKLELLNCNLHCRLFACSGNMQNLCHTLSLFHACSLNNYCLLQPKHVCFIILGLMPVVVTCMYLFYCFLGFVHITCTCLFEKHVFNRGKCDTGFPVPLTCQPVYKMGYILPFFWI